MKQWNNLRMVEITNERKYIVNDIAFATEIFVLLVYLENICMEEETLKF